MSDFSSRPPGRPRSQKVHRAILKAARELLLEVGIYEMSIEKVAERARVGKATIYRRWSSKDELIAEAMGGLTDEIILPNSGDSIKDVKILCGQMLEAYQEQMNFKGVTHLITSMISNDRLLDVYRKEFVEPRREAFAYVLNRGQARGELREDLDIDLTIDLLGGLFVYELLFSPEKLLSENFLDRVESVLLKGLLK